METTTDIDAQSFFLAFKSYYVVWKPFPKPWSEAL